MNRRALLLGAGALAVSPVLPAPAPVLADHERVQLIVDEMMRRAVRVVRAERVAINRLVLHITIGERITRE